MNQSFRQRRQGIALIWAVIFMVVFLAFASFAVDWGRVQLTKTELQRAADASALAAANALPGGVGNTKAIARQYAAYNFSVSKSITLNDNEIIMGQWKSTTKTIDTNATVANCVRVTVHTRVPLTFASYFGRDGMDVTASATAVYVSPIDITADIPAQANPYLAGMKNGTIAQKNGNPHNNPDYAGSHYYSRTGLTVDTSPPQAQGLPLVSGQKLTFGSISGVANNDVTFDPNVNFQPDGDTTNIVNNNYGGGSTSEFGKSDIRAPMNAVIGVFLNDKDPSKTSAPSTLDFSTASSRNFSTLSPQLKQVFFIGDGVTSQGVLQQFVVPPGATRLFLGNMDEYEWNNNRGTRVYRITQPGNTYLVN